VRGISSVGREGGLHALEHWQGLNLPQCSSYYPICPLCFCSCDAYHMTDPRADGLGVSTCIELALKVGRASREGCSPQEVVWVGRCAREQQWLV
jgi:hypothetical protein